LREARDVSRICDDFAPIRACAAAEPLSGGTVRCMGNEPGIVGERERANLLSKCIVIVSADAVDSGLQVRATGADDERVRAEVAAELGPDVEVEVWGRFPNELSPRPCAGYMEREPGRLQLRYVLYGDDHLDDIWVAEDDRRVVVLAAICTSVVGTGGDGMEGPWHVYLDRPLGDRTVIDALTGEPVRYKNIYEELERRRA
jgi:hypothetical protein